MHPFPPSVSLGTLYNATSSFFLVVFYALFVLLGIQGRIKRTTSTLHAQTMFKENKQLFSHGTITELFSFFMSSVVLMTYDEGQHVELLSLGCFSINLIMNATCPILATICSAEGIQWPLTKDTVVIQMAKRTFAFALPGLLYGLQFPEVCPEEHINTLESVFMKFGHFMDINDKRRGNNHKLPKENEPNLWNRLRHHIEPMAHETLVHLGQLPGLSRFRVSNHNSCFLRASRMSATTKLITYCMVHSETLTSSHISITGTNPSDAHLHDQDLSYASLCVFNTIVDAVELSWVVSSGLDNLLKDAEPPLRACSNDIGFKVWSLNEDDVVAFMHHLGPFVEKEEEFFNGNEKRCRDKVKEIEIYASGYDKEKGEEETSARAYKNNDKGKGVEP